jgi:putative hydrolase of the HAD superfamily
MVVTPMIKAVFFDLYNTVATYEPPREELQARALKGFGIEASPESLRRPLFVADEYIYAEMARSSLNRRSREEQMAVMAEYERILFREAGIDADDKVIMGVLGATRKMDRKMVLFDDVLPALQDLNSRSLILGLISNVDQDITGLLNDLQLSPLLSVVVTSQDLGATKPDPRIFLEAVNRAGVRPPEAMYVGDQYQIDVVGANEVGLKGVLLDRGDYLSDIAGSPRIHRLTEVAGHLS